MDIDEQVSGEAEAAVSSRTETDFRSFEPPPERLSREFQSGPKSPCATESASKKSGSEPSTVAAAYPNTELAMRSRPGVFALAEDLLAAVFARSLEAVKRRRRRRWTYPATAAAARAKDGALYSAAAAFVDRLVAEGGRRASAVESHGVRRLATYRSPDEFSIADGVELVLSWMGRWRVNPYWHVKVLYAGRNLTDDCHTYYYTARLSVPTLGSPVAQVTCDVHFTVDVACAAPPPLRIDVWFRVETDRWRRSTLAHTFHQEWIDNVVRWKLRTFRTLHF